MRRISSATLPNAAVALVVVSAIVVSAGMGQARAEDCLAAPNVAAPGGQHWYYRIDRVNRRKCWYLHAAARIARQVHGAASGLPDAKVEQTAPAVVVPIADAPAPENVTNDSPPDNAASPPHITVLAVKTVAVPDLSVRSVPAPRGRADQPSISQAQARAYSATRENKSEPTTFFLLVFGLGVTVFLVAIVIKSAAPQARWRSRIEPDADMRPRMPWSVKPRPYPPRFVSG